MAVAGRFNGFTKHDFVTKIKYINFVHLEQVYLTVSEVFGVEEDDGDGDVVPKHPDHVLRQ